jgi:thiol:disulfide interchange protein DsbD
MKYSFGSFVLSFILWTCQFLMWMGFCLTFSAHAQTFLPPEQAFQYQIKTTNINKTPAAVTSFVVAPSYYLYQESLKIKSLTPTVTVDFAQLPPAKQKYDEAFGKDVFYYRDKLDLPLRITIQSDKNGGGADLPEQFQAELKYQGCADAGLCYPPIKQIVTISLPKKTSVSEVVSVISSRAHISSAKPNLNLSSNQNQNLSPNAVNKQTQVQPQHSLPALPASAVNASTVHSTMDGVASEAALPAQSTLDVVKQINQQQTGVVDSLLKGGSFGLIVAVFFVIGLLLAFTPCVLPMIPILVGYLLGQHRGTIKGGLISVAYSLGVVLIYTLFGVLAGLTGKNLALWLQKPVFLILFAVLLLLFALSMFGLFHLKLPHRFENRLSQLYDKQPKFRWFGAFVMGCLSALMVGPCITPALLGVLLHIAQTQDVSLGASALAAMGFGMCVPLLVLGMLSSQLTPFFRKLNQFSVWFKGFFGVLLLFLAFWTLIPVLPNSIVPKTVAQWRGVESTPSALPFKRVHNLEALQSALAEHRGQPVLLDFYATWCRACIEMEHKTFADQAVREALKDVVLLQVDVTAHSQGDRQLYQYFNIFGPPMILWFDSQGDELKSLRVTGFMDAQRFLEHVQAYQNTFRATNVPRLAHSQ